MIIPFDRFQCPLALESQGFFLECEHCEIRSLFLHSFFSVDKGSCAFHFHSPQEDLRHSCYWVVHFEVIVKSRNGVVNDQLWSWYLKFIKGYKICIIPLYFPVECQVKICRACCLCHVIKEISLLGDIGH